MCNLTILVPFETKKTSKFGTLVIEFWQFRRFWWSKITNLMKITFWNCQNSQICKEINQISEVLLSNNIEAVIISNTSDSTRNDLRNIQGHQKGGLSGKPIELKSTELVRKFYNILNGKIKIIGVGGVDSGRSAYEKFIAGANYVQLYTGMVFRGPNIVNMIKKELKELLLKDGVKNFSEIIGKTK